jgi:hypothetical protein
MGNIGFRALLSRALVLASAELPWLSAARVEAGGVLQGLGKAQAQLGPDELIEGEVVLLAQLIGLLVAFIGENLTLRLAREIWPKIPLYDLDFSNPDTNGKSK